MTQEEKQLLLIDLCARLPYGVKVKFYSMEYPYGSEPVILTVHLLKDRWENIYDVKPYLRPMSSMTEEERIEFERLSFVYDTSDGSMLFSEKGLDWLNTNYFDYRGLIEKGLALEAPKGMYKTE